MGADTGTVFVDVSDPHAPVLIGELWDGAPTEPECANPWSAERNACGLGFEAALLLPLLAAWRTRRTSPRIQWRRGP